MKITLCCLVIVAGVGASYAVSQYGGYFPAPFGFGGYPNYPIAPPRQQFYGGNIGNTPNEYLFRENNAPIEYSGSPQARGGTITITIATTTYTSTITTSSTCTTSTAALSVCSPSGGRRRRAALPHVKSALFFHDKPEEDEDIFFVKPNKRESRADEPKIVTSLTENKPEETVVPFVVQPGYQAPVGAESFARFLVAFGTSTSTITTTSTYQYTLTATCISTTSYQLCGVFG